MEKMTSGFRGIYRDIIKDPENGIYIDSGWKNNSIMDRGRILLASFMRGEMTTGIYKLGVGQGDPAWDNLNTEAIPKADPQSTNDLLVPHEPRIIVNKPDITYLGDSDNPTDGPTTRLQISVTLAPDYPPPPAPGESTFPLREFGLFGKFGETEYMINSIRHPVIHKGITTTMIRMVRLYF